MLEPTQTEETYGQLNRAYGFFNLKLFDGTLPECVITLQRKSQAYGRCAVLVSGMEGHEFQTHAPQENDANAFKTDTSAITREK
jgi:hypothetical protein